ncbi:hypothetical protein [Nocardia nepalensis]|uniref:hypothetical protein n=1 Tax=Nocardia nepalensis TaxID=3375448 RepID=UPI003B67BF44
MSMFRFRRRAPFAWTKELQLKELQQPTKVVPLNGLSSMAKLRSGALLNWVFDEPDYDTTYHLFVYLTDAESQKVYDAPVDAGMLEPVRGKLTNRGGILAVISDADVATRRYEIPERGLEPEFIADLLIAAKTLPEYVEAVTAGARAELDRIQLRQAEYQLGRDQAAHKISQYATQVSRLRASVERVDNNRDDVAVSSALRQIFA